MRILHVSEVPIGGVAAVLKAFVAGQAQRGHQPTLLCPGALEVPGTRHVPWRVDRRRPWRYPDAVWQFRTALRATQPDVVHLHSFFAGLFGRTLGAGVPSGVGVVYQPHGWNYLAARNSYD